MQSFAHSSASFEHGTPTEIVEAARRLMGRITLDVASDPIANETVKADRFLTLRSRSRFISWRDDDGPSKILLNPPGGKTRGKSNQALWALKLLKEFHEGNVQEAVYVGFSIEVISRVPELMNYPSCFVTNTASSPCVAGSGRIMFNNYGPGWTEREGSPTHGNVLFYLNSKGEKFGRFKEEFSQFGRVGIHRDY